MNRFLFHDSEKPKSKSQRHFHELPNPSEDAGLRIAGIESEIFCELKPRGGETSSLLCAVTMTTWTVASS